MENHIIIKYLKTLGYEIQPRHQSHRQKYYHNYDTQRAGSWKTINFKIDHKELLIQDDELYLDLDTNPITHDLVKIDMSTEQTIRQAIDQ